MSSNLADERLAPGVAATEDGGSSDNRGVLLAPPQSQHISSRDALLRRMLALADLGAAVAVAAALAIPGGDVAKAFWALVFAPVCVLLAKLHALYDYDSRALRHVTVDEIPSISVWAVSVTATIGVLLMLTPTETLTLGQAVYMWLTAAGAAFCLRGVARALW